MAGPLSMAALFVGLLTAGGVRASAPVAVHGRAMGTSWTVKFIQPAPALDAGIVRQHVADRLEALEQQFSTYRPGSELSRFNGSAGTDWLAVSPELARVAVNSRGISELTGGAFDVTIDPLVRLWGFGPPGRNGVLPAEADIVRARARVDWRQLEARLDPPALRKIQRGIAADFSSMAKGFAADAVGEVLVALGVPNHLVQIGGDLKASGAGEHGGGWPAGIQQPLGESRAIADVVMLTGLALSTSGDYRNSFLADGQRYGHIIDPRTGCPVASALASVSVVQASGAMASALATALFVLGPDAGFQLAEAHGLACLFLVRDGADFARRATREFESLRR
jgi:thiamine biosynthesis lipoprotein